MESSAFINGPEVSAFQKELEAYLGVKHVIPCANGTDALQISLMALGLEKGDEVITSDFTFAATVEVIALLGLKQVLVVDVDRDTMVMDVKALEKAITPRTKAIIPVHLFGQCADMEPIMEIAREYNLAVVRRYGAGHRSGIYFFRRHGKESGHYRHSWRHVFLSV